MPKIYKTTHHIKYIITFIVGVQLGDITRISSLGKFHAVFNRHCQKFYSFEFICHNCCEGYEDHGQDMTLSNEGREDEYHEEEQDVLGRLMEMVKSLSAEIERFKFEESIEDFPVLEVEVLGVPTDDGEVEDCTAIEATYSTPDVAPVSEVSEEIVVYSDKMLIKVGCH
jgi:hypothetical protein